MSAIWALSRRDRRASMISVTAAKPRKEPTQAPTRATCLAILVERPPRTWRNDSRHRAQYGYTGVGRHQVRAYGAGAPRTPEDTAGHLRRSDRSTPSGTAADG